MPAVAPKWVTVIAIGTLAIAASVMTARYIIQLWYGTPVNISSYPFVVSLENAKGVHKCAGVLLSDQWVLTAAHCLFPAQVRANSDRLRTSDAVHLDGNVRKVETRCVHYKNAPVSGEPDKNDLQLLKVVSFGSHRPPEFARPGPLRESIFTVLGWEPKVRVLGWGQTENSQYPDQLHKVTVATVSDSVCRKNHSGFTNIQAEHLCFGEPPKGTCHGDSGGPVLNRWSSEVVAIVSGPGTGTCGQANDWTVGAELVYYDAWITKVMGGDRSECAP